MRHPLYATWAMVYHMETAARMLLAPYLEADDEEAVGGAVLVKHLRPARIGAPLHVFAKLVRVRGLAHLCANRGAQPRAQDRRGLGASRSS